MKIYPTLQLFLAFFCTSVLAAEWTKIDESTLKMYGVIEQGDFEKFRSAYDKTIKKLVVRSNGGDAEETMKIAEVLLDNQLEFIEVDGWCMSSCGNYLFTAAKRKDVSMGIVGFHGATFNLAERKAGFSSEQTWLDRLAIRELNFFKRAGVHKNIFYKSMGPSKGSTDGKTYYMLIPNAKTLFEAGILNVNGDYPLLWLDPKIWEKTPIYVETP